MILITGATGFLGQSLLSRLYMPESKIRVLSRNEGKLIELKQKFPSIEIITGDVANEYIVEKALKGVDKVYHLSAFKHVGMAEEQPLQCIETNIIGTINLLKHFTGETFLAISTDKASKVSGVYGASKMLMEKTVSDYASLYKDIDYRIVRYGNVIYSTGSVLCKWKELLQEGKEIIVTDLCATRFFWTVEQSIDLIFDCLKYAKDSTPYCPNMKSMTIGDLLEAMQQKYGKAKSIKTIGLQKGENKHETIKEGGITSEDAIKYTIPEIKELI